MANLEAPPASFSGLVYHHGIIPYRFLAAVDLRMFLYVDEVE